MVTIFKNSYSEVLAARLLYKVVEISRMGYLGEVRIDGSAVHSFFSCEFREELPRKPC